MRDIIFTQGGVRRFAPSLPWAANVTPLQGWGMLFFVMYDIESNKVRTLVHKYLKRMGCTPIQHSVFLADTPIETYNRIKEDLAAVQEAYDNDDSILVAPVSSDYLKMMKIIGHKIELDVITHSRSTLFF